MNTATKIGIIAILTSFIPSLIIIFISGAASLPPRLTGYIIPISRRIIPVKTPPIVAAIAPTVISQIACWSFSFGNFFFIFVPPFSS